MIHGETSWCTGSTFHIQYAVGLIIFFFLSISLHGETVPLRLRPTSQWVCSSGNHKLIPASGTYDSQSPNARTRLVLSGGMSVFWWLFFFFFTGVLFMTSNSTSLIKKWKGSKRVTLKIKRIADLSNCVDMSRYFFVGTWPLSWREEWHASCVHLGGSDKIRSRDCKRSLIKDRTSVPGMNSVPQQ